MAASFEKAGHASSDADNEPKRNDNETDNRYFVSRLPVRIISEAVAIPCMRGRRPPKEGEEINKHTTKGTQSRNKSGGLRGKIELRICRFDFVNHPVIIDSIDFWLRRICALNWRMRVVRLRV